MTLPADFFFRYRTIIAAVAGFGCIILSAWQLPESVAFRSELTAVRGKVESARDGVNIKTWTERKYGVKRSRKIIGINLQLTGMDTVFTLQEAYSGNDNPFHKLAATLNAADTVKVWYLLETTPDNTLKRVYEIENQAGKKLYAFYDTALRQLLLFVFLLLAGLVLLGYSIRRIFGNNAARGERVV